MGGSNDARKADLLRSSSCWVSEGRTSLVIG